MSPDDLTWPQPVRPADDRRTAERVIVLGTLTAEVLVSQPIEIAEISGAGIQILSRFPFVLESLHEFRLALDAEIVVVKGRITHCSIVDVDQERVEYRSGVEFADVPRPIAEMITDYANALRQRRMHRAPSPTTI